MTPDQLPHDAGARGSELSRILMPAQGGRHLRFNLTPLPLQFPSTGHLDTCVAVTIARAVSTEGLSPRTERWMRDGYRSFRRFLRDGAGREREFLGGNAHAQVRLLHDWIAWLRHRGASHATTATYFHAWKTILRRIEEQEGMFNPTAVVRPPKAAPPLPRCLTRANAEAVLRFVRNYGWRTTFERRRNLALVALMLMAGLRKSEVVRLENADVSFETRSIAIRRGKGRHGGKDRTAYMTGQLGEILLAYEESRRDARKTHAEFLSSTTRDCGIGEITIRRLFKRISAAVETRVTPHMLRHTYATQLRASGVPDRVAQELLGHSSLTMLQRYSHVYEGEHAREAGRLRFDF